MTEPQKFVVPAGVTRVEVTLFDHGKPVGPLLIDVVPGQVISYHLANYAAGNGGAASSTSMGSRSYATVGNGGSASVGMVAGGSSEQPNYGPKPVEIRIRSMV